MSRTVCGEIIFSISFTVTVFHQRSSWTPAADTAAHRPRRRPRPRHRANKINSRKSKAAFGNGGRVLFCLEIKKNGLINLIDNLARYEQVVRLKSEDQNQKRPKTELPPSTRHRKVVFEGSRWRKSGEE
jgi:hypothetical protein